MIDGSPGAKSTRTRRAPTTNDPIELAMGAERAGFAVKVLTGGAGVAAAVVAGQASGASGVAAKPAPNWTA